MNGPRDRWPVAARRGGCSSPSRLLLLLRDATRLIGKGCLRDRCSSNLLQPRSRSRAVSRRLRIASLTLEGLGTALSVSRPVFGANSCRRAGAGSVDRGPTRGRVLVSEARAALSRALDYTDVWFRVSLVGVVSIVGMLSRTFERPTLLADRYGGLACALPVPGRGGCDW